MVQQGSAGSQSMANEALVRAAKVRVREQAMERLAALQESVVTKTLTTVPAIREVA